MQGTVNGVPEEEFDAEAACKKLYNGMKGLGTDENALVEVFGIHNNAQRQVIKEKYKTMYGKVNNQVFLYYLRHLCSNFSAF